MAFFQPNREPTDLLPNRNSKLGPPMTQLRSATLLAFFTDRWRWPGRGSGFSRGWRRGWESSGSSGILSGCSAVPGGARLKQFRGGGERNLANWFSGNLGSWECHFRFSQIAGSPGSAVCGFSWSCFTLLDLGATLWSDRIVKFKYKGLCATPLWPLCSNSGRQLKFLRSV